MRTEGQNHHRSLPFPGDAGRQDWAGRLPSPSSVESRGSSPQKPQILRLSPSTQSRAGRRDYPARRSSPIWVSASCDVGSSPISRRDPARESTSAASLDVKAGGGKQQPRGALQPTARASIDTGHFCIHRTAALRSITVLDGFVVLKLPLLGGHSPLGPALDGGTDGARTSGKSRPQGHPADLSCDHVAEPARLSRHGLPHRRDIDAVSGLRGIFRCRRDAVWRTLESVIAFVMWSISFRLVAGA
jgi:hypothetical protein